MPQRQSPDAPASPGLLRSPDFRKLWAGQTISALGSRITGGGLPLLVLLNLGASPFQMGLLQAAGSAPVLLFSLLAACWPACGLPSRPSVNWINSQI